MQLCLLGWLSTPGDIQPSLGTVLLFTCLELLLIPSGLRLGTPLEILRTGQLLHKESSSKGQHRWDGKPRPRLQSKEVGVGRSDKVPSLSSACVFLSTVVQFSPSKAAQFSWSALSPSHSNFSFVRQMYYQTLQSPESVIHFWECVPVLEFKMLPSLHPRGLAPKLYLQAPKSDKQMSKNNKEESLVYPQDQIIDVGRHQNCLHKTAIS